VIGLVVYFGYARKRSLLIRWRNRRIHAERPKPVQYGFPPNRSESQVTIKSNSRRKLAAWACEIIAPLNRPASVSFTPSMSVAAQVRALEPGQLERGVAQAAALEHRLAEIAAGQVGVGESPVPSASPS
jgi:hypothetical protein